MARRKVPSEQLEAAEAAIIDRSKRIEFYTTEYNVEILVNKLKSGDFFVPRYQRDFNWDEPRKSKFIESVLIGLPIPFLFFWESDDGRMEIVDGSQRLRTLREYISGELALQKLEEIPFLNGTTFLDLSNARKRKFLNRSIRGIVLNENADPQARFDMFERINTGSKVANPAEVRRGALTGPFQDLVEALAQEELFKKLAPVSAKSKSERVPDEMVTRFFAYGDGVEEYKDSPNRFVFEYTKRMNEQFDRKPELKDQYRDRFMQMLKFVERNFSTGFTKKTNPKTTPRVRFEAIAIGVDHAIREHPALANSTLNSVSDWIEGDDFKKVTTSDAANVKSKLIGRIDFVKNALLR